MRYNIDVMRKGQCKLNGGRQVVAVSLSPELRAELRREAQEAEESVSAIVRKAVKAYLKAQKPE